MYLLNVTDLYTTIDYVNFTDNCTINENNIDIIIPKTFSNNTMWSIIFLVNEFDGIHIN